MKHIRTSLLASCLIANLGLVAVAQTDTTATSTSTATTTQKKTKHSGFRKHRLKNIFKKKTDTTTTTTK